jgi:hypothetical protein
MSGRTVPGSLMLAGYEPEWPPILCLASPGRRRAPPPENERASILGLFMRTMRPPRLS